MDKLAICKLRFQVLVMQLPEAEFLSKQLQNHLLLLNQIWTISVNNCKINKGDIEKVAKFPGNVHNFKVFFVQNSAHIICVM